jgi:hypothetical protein
MNSQGGSQRYNGDILRYSNLANKIEEYKKCDDFSGEISQLTETQTQSRTLMFPQASQTSHPEEIRAF